MSSAAIIAALRSIRAEYKLTQPQRLALALAIGSVQAREDKEHTPTYHD